MKFNGICIETDNAPRLADFYKTVFQEEPFIEGSHYGFSKVAVYDPGNVTVARDKNIWLQCFVADLDVEYERLLKEIPDIEITSPPERRPWGAYSFQFVDPDGNKIAVAEKAEMKKSLYMSHSVFPTPDIERTSEYYVTVMGFRAVKYLEATEPHICLYRDDTEIILTSANTDRVYPNRELYGYGYDAYFITDDQQSLQDEFLEKGAKIVRPLQKTDYHNQEFVVEDIDGRWIGFGIKDE